jgi:long-chain acyl-CoA synthetase
MARRSLVEYLDEFQARGNEPAYVQPRGYRRVRWSYRQVAETAFRFARELSARAVEKGDRVLIWGPNSAEWVAAFFGCAVVGAIVVPIDDAATSDFVLRVCGQVQAKFILGARPHAAIAFPAPLVTLEDLADALAGHSGSSYRAAAIAAGDALEIVFTSGTTAEPKGVVITHGNVLANIAPLATEIRKYLKYERLVHPVRFLNLLPLSHVFGQFLGIFLPQLLGGTVIFEDTLKPAELIRTVRRERVSVLVGVPRLLQSLREKIERDLEEQGGLKKFRQRFRQAEGKPFLWRWWIFRRVRRQFGWKFWAFIAGGAALDRDSEEFWGRLGYAVIQGYGLTETTSIVSVNHPFRLGKGSVGRVLAGREVALGADGEIMVRGGGVAAGYWDGNELRPVAGASGWYGTGDIGELDADGNLYFKGRKKDVLVTPAGMNVYPEDLEAALRRQPAVKDCVVVGLPREGNAEACAVLILRPGHPDPEPVVQRANQALAEYQRMHAWFVWPEEDFPRTSTGKPRTRQIQQTVLAGRSAQPADDVPPGPLAELIARIAKRTPARLDPTANLEADLNLGSLDRVELLSALEDRYQLDLSETRFASVNTVGELEQMLRAKTRAAMPYHYPRWVQRWPVTWIRLATHYLLLLPAVYLLGRPRIEGREHLASVEGPVLVVSNHVSDVDLGFVLAALPARLRHRLATATAGEALESLRTPPPARNFLARGYDRLKWALGVALLNLFPLPREAGFRRSFAYAGESVDRGYSVLVFPEGRHTADGQISPFRAGIGLLVNNLSLPVVPVRIDGLQELKQAGRKFAGPGQIQVKVGAPVRFARDTDPEQIARELQGKVEAL